MWEMLEDKLELVEKLDFHGKSHVKGITFDLDNRFFATSEGDKTFKIIQIDFDENIKYVFTEAAKVEGTFKNSTNTTFFRRCSWSPDGNHIAVSNAVNGTIPIVTIVNRDVWDSDISLVGHES